MRQHSLTSAAHDVEPLMPARTRFAGQPIDVSSRRSIQLANTNGSSVDLSAEAAEVVIDYFRHADQFWRAVLPIGAVRDVRGQVFNFSRPRMRQGPDGPEVMRSPDGVPRRRIPILNHLQTRFTIDPDQPMRLYKLGAAIDESPVHQLDDFVYSVEAIGPVAATFNLYDAVFGNLVSAHRFLSTEQMVFERVVVENQFVVESPALPVKVEDARELLRWSLRRSNRAGMKERYYLYRPCGTNNCTSNPFKILDSVVDYTRSQRLGALLYRLPLNPRFYLRIRGLDTNPNVRFSLRDEFSEFVNNPSTQQRKRQYVRLQIAARRKTRDTKRRR